MATVNKKRALVCAALAVCSVLVAVAAQEQRVSFIARRDFDAGVNPRSVTLGDFNGTLALGWGSGGGGVPEHAQSTRAALDGTFTTIDVPGAVSTACNGIVDDFSPVITGRFTSPDGVVHGFVRQGASFFSVDFPDNPDVNFTSVTGITVNLASVFGSFDTHGGAGCLTPGSGSCHMFIAGEFGFLEVTFPGTTNLVVLGVNSGGVVNTGAYTGLDDGNVHGWRTNPGLSTVDPPGATLTFATGNNSFDFVGRWDTDDGVTHGYQHLQGGDFEPIDVPDALSTVAHGINISRVVVGEYVDQGGLTHGFVFQDGAFQTVDFPDATATVVKGIGTGGRMVGVYTDADGIEHGFLYTPNSAAPESRTP